MEGLRTLGDEELRRALMSVKGVGVKVADCVSLFAYHRLAVFPVDVWITRVLAERYGGKIPYADTEYGGVVQQYLFYYARSGNL